MNMQSTLRLIDANANRAREGIRTAEDYIRFTIGNPLWAQRLQILRRGITEGIENGFGNQAMRARAVQLDVNRPDAARSVEVSELSILSDLDSNEQQKAESPKDIAVRGLKRAQEALRVLEEFTRGAPKVFKTFSLYRFELYKAEQWLLCGADYHRRLWKAKLYVLLTQDLCQADWLKTAEAALKGGAGIIQLREKAFTASELAKRTQALQALCEAFDALCIVNDRPDVAVSVQAGGVHLGQEDLSPEVVRGWAGAGMVIGRSTHSVEQAQAEAVGAVDYIAIGSMYPTTTKKNPELVGVELAKKIGTLALKMPVFAIGGITVARVRELREVGIKRVAVSSAVISERDPESAAKHFLEALA